MRIPPYIFISIFFLVAVVLLSSVYFWVKNNSEEREQMGLSNTTKIRFMPIGDSYTIGNGLKIEERWPNLLVESLAKEGLEVEIIRNPAVSGYAADDALAREIPKFERDRPDFGTLFIGTNDSFRGRDINQFRAEYVELLTRMQNSLTMKNNLVVITIPNYAHFPGIEGEGVTSEDIEKYNRVIREEGMKRNLAIVDLYPIDALVGDDNFIRDGIHPSAKGVRIWHDAIFPVVRDLLKN